MEPPAFASVTTGTLGKPLKRLVVEIVRALPLGHTPPAAQRGAADSSSAAAAAGAAEHSPEEEEVEEEEQAASGRAQSAAAATTEGQGGPQAGGDSVESRVREYTLLGADGKAVTSGVCAARPMPQVMDGRLPRATHPEPASCLPCCTRHLFVPTCR